ncbi:universal stress protein [Streptosporangium subroseum]|uniref:universal stress protein n=1 Tax=Streptosporangium subroseum TaxID=106412 RepID=UPI00308E1146|nr:universal stress protein [Streptosporangium subroseum]
MYKHILTAIDSSPRGDRVLDAVEYLAGVTGADVQVLHAEEREIFADQVVDLETDEEARAIVDRAVARLRGAGITAEGEVIHVLREGVPDNILARARELGSDLIVLGPRHHGRLGALLGASVSHEVSLHASVSLLLVV